MTIEYNPPTYQDWLDEYLKSEDGSWRRFNIWAEAGFWVSKAYFVDTESEELGVILLPKSWITI